MTRWVVIAIGLLALALLLLYPLAHASAQEHHHPTETIHGATAKFYETWMRPDVPTSSCCNKQDCYMTRIRRVSGKSSGRPPRERGLDRHSAGEDRGQPRQPGRHEPHVRHPWEVRVLLQGRRRDVTRLVIGLLDGVGDKVKLAEQFNCELAIAASIALRFVFHKRLQHAPRHLFDLSQSHVLLAPLVRDQAPLALGFLEAGDLGLS